MATAALAGYNGSIAGPTGTLEIKSWTADMNIVALDATSMASNGYMEYIPGLKGVTGNFKSLAPITAHSGLQALTLKSNKTSGGITLTGSAIISKVTPDVPVDGVVSYDCDFSFTGSIAIT